mmetsp:Transcript_35807/g.83427  ORF Transcript_35807/g.83427 Transcript_35807/m.83427 type:complete len:324 (-) Transcript_35807:976-1947(-)
MGNAKISLGPHYADLDTSCGKHVAHRVSGYLLTVEGESRSDVGFLCNKLLEEFSRFESISTSPLCRTVSRYQSKLKPDTGRDAELTKDPELLDTIFGSQRDDVLSKLARDGFVTIDSGIKASPASQLKLSEMLQEKTEQKEFIRSDSVRFLDRENAASCGLEKQYDFMMAISSYLNEHFSPEESPNEPILPGTHDRPLTNPARIQAAAYGENEYYVAHSDNPIDDDTHTRRNFRWFTYILYCNDGWDLRKDGGALRIYPDCNTGTVKESSKYVDINPINGKLLVFDSRLVHSVEKVTSKTRRRLALTLWALRPEDRNIVAMVR